MTDVNRGMVFVMPPEFRDIKPGLRSRDLRSRDEPQKCLKPNINSCKFRNASPDGSLNFKRKERLPMLPLKTEQTKMHIGAEIVDI